MNFRVIAAVSFAAALIAGAFFLGVKHSRGQIRQLAEHMTANPANSFTRCLTQTWEESGELNTDWRAQRRWVLETKP